MISNSYDKLKWIHFGYIWIHKRSKNEPSIWHFLAFYKIEHFRTKKEPEKMPTNR